MSTIQSGDYTRTIIEGYWDGPPAEEGVQTDADQWEFKSAVGDKVTVEKIAPPVTVFKPGDRLRRKLVDGWSLPFEITVADGGYLQHHNDGSVLWYEHERVHFDSELYEKVNLAVVPF